LNTENANYSAENRAGMYRDQDEDRVQQHSKYVYIDSEYGVE
jgi:hypothetical protein